MTAPLMHQEIANRRPLENSPCCPTCRQTGELQAEQETRDPETLDVEGDKPLKLPCT